MSWASATKKALRTHFGLPNRPTESQKSEKRRKEEARWIAEDREWVMKHRERENEELRRWGKPLAQDMNFDAMASQGSDL